MPLQVGDIVEGKVTDIMDYGVFVKLPEGKSGLVHISEVARDYVDDIRKVIKQGESVKVKILSIDEKGKIALSIKKALPQESKLERLNFNKEKPTIGPVTLDDMLLKFMKDSDERQLDLKRSFEAKRGSSRKHC